MAAAAAIVSAEVHLTTGDNVEDERRPPPPPPPSSPPLTSVLVEPTQTLTPTSSRQYEESVTRKKTKKRERSPTSTTTTTNSIITSNETVTTNTQSTITTNTSTNPSQLPLGVTATSLAASGKKEKQRPETWNKTEQQIFFNALRQNGKNFESITQCFNARQKKYKLSQEGTSSGTTNTTNNSSGGCMQRSKEQIRHFYYRTWHKIAKYINIPAVTTTANPSSKKITSTITTTTDILSSSSKETAAFTINMTTSDTLRDIQVKCLIAFNTLMNKSQRWNKKTAIKLVELINHGWTTVRDKGKINRLRMPICKLHGAADPSSVVKSHQSDAEKKTSDYSNTKQQRVGSIDMDITDQQQNNGFANNNNGMATTSQQNASENSGNNNIESRHYTSYNIQLEPQSLAAFCRVQRLAQNPFLSVDVAPEQTLKFLIQFLENKWKSRRSQFLERFNISGGSGESKNEAWTTAADDLNTSNNEKLVLYLNESHLTCLSSQTTATTSTEILKTEATQPATEATPSVIVKPGTSSIMNDNSFLMSSDEMTILPTTTNNNIENYQDEHPMAMDECAIIPDEEFCSHVNLKSTDSNKNGTGHQHQLSFNPSSQPSQFLSSVFEVTLEQLKAGFSSTTSQVSLHAPDSISNNINKKEKRVELTFADLHTILNKSTHGVIRLKYEWSLKTTTTTSGEQINPTSGVNNNNNASSSSQQVLSMSSSQHQQQQRFYLDTLASVAASFLNDLKPKSLNENGGQKQSANNQSGGASGGLFKLPQVPPPPPQSTSSAGLTPLQQKSSILNSHQQQSAVTTTTTAFTAKSSSGKSVAFLQPMSSNRTTTIIPMDQMLQRVSEDQQNRAKQLLSDLNNAKRRSRQRKPIMVVNTGPGQPPPHRHLLLPKLTTNAKNENMTGDNQQQQPNIVYSSGPVATVVRQIVLNDDAINMINQEQNINNIGLQQQQHQHPFHHFSSNLMLSSNYNNLIVENGTSTSCSSSDSQQAAAITTTNDIHHGLVDVPSSQTSGNITDMSLLELSLNNVDSLFAPTASTTTTTSNPTSNLISTDDDVDNNNTIVSSTPMNAVNSGAILSPTDDDEDHHVFGTNNQELMISGSGHIDDIMNDNHRKQQLNNNNNNNTLSCSQKSIGLSSASKLLRNFSSFLNDNSISLSGILSTFYGGKSSNQEENVDQSQHQQQQATTSSMATRRPTEIQSTVEWSDSMNDVSLTSYFMTDMQSPEKQQQQHSSASNTSGLRQSTTNTSMLMGVSGGNNNNNQNCLHHMSDNNSRDSILFNMETIMDILPPPAGPTASNVVVDHSSRFDEINK